MEIEVRPWVTPDAIPFFESLVNSEMRVFEFGSGASTLWLSDKVGSLTSVDHNKEWHSIIRSKLQDMYDPIHLVHIDLLFIEDENQYAESILEYGGYFDLIFIDGAVRSECVKTALHKIKTGGWIIFDNAEKEHHSKGVQLLNDCSIDTQFFYGMNWATHFYKI